MKNKIKKGMPIVGLFMSFCGLVIISFVVFSDSNVRAVNWANIKTNYLAYSIGYFLVIFGSIIHCFKKI